MTVSRAANSDVAISLMRCRAAVKSVMRMAMSAICVIGNSIATCVVAKWEGEYDPKGEHEPLEDPEPAQGPALA